MINFSFQVVRKTFGIIIVCLHRCICNNIYNSMQPFIINCLCKYNGKSFSYMRFRIAIPILCILIVHIYIYTYDL